MKKELDIGKCFSDGWELYKKNLSVLVLAGLVCNLVSGLTLGVLSGPLIIGFLMIIDRLIKNDPEIPAVADVFKGFEKFLQPFLVFLLFSIIYGLTAIVPPLAILSIVIAPLMIFSYIYVAFEGMDAIDAIKRVFTELFSGQILMPVLLGILASVVAAAGMLACCIGIFFTAPYALVVYMMAYKQMTEARDITDAEIIPPDPLDRDVASGGEQSPDVNSEPETAVSEESDAGAETERPKAE